MLVLSWLRLAFTTSRSLVHDSHGTFNTLRLLLSQKHTTSILDELSAGT